MALAFKADFQGSDDATLRRLRGLEDNVRLKVIREAIDAGVKILAEAEAAAAPVSDPQREPQLESGLLKKSMDSKVKAYRQSLIVVGISGAKRAFKKPMGRYELRARFMMGNGLVRDLRQYKRERLTIQVAKKGILGLLGQKRKKRILSDAKGYQVPANYVHLAGPGRHQEFMTVAENSIPAAEAAAIAKLQEAVAKV